MNKLFYKNLIVKIKNLILNDKIWDTQNYGRTVVRGKKN